MSSGKTNRGKKSMLDVYYRGATPPTVFYVALFTDATPPGADINTKSELTEIAAGNGYTAGGIAVARNSTDFDVLTEDDVNDRALVQIKNLVWTASGGQLPASGDGASFAGLTDDNGTLASREVFDYWDLSTPRQVSDGQTLTLIDCEMRLNHA